MSNACIWGHKEYKEVLRIQYNAMQFLLGVGKACPIVGLFGETGWVPLSLTITFNILRFRNRILKMEESRLPFRMYAWSTSLAGNGV